MAPLLSTSSITTEDSPSASATTDENADLVVENNNNNLLDAWIQHDSTDFHSFTNSEAAQIRSKLLDWYRQHRRKLPWRGDPPPWQGSTANFAGKKSKAGDDEDNKQQTKLTSFFAAKKESSKDKDKDSLQRQYPVSAYGIWVSEIMLQQTRVEAVVQKWCQWMTSLPTVHDLAKATPEEVNAHWAGLGFYRRSRLLHSAAQYVVDKLDGEMPKTVEGLLELPGVGRYTASAIASIAYNVTVPVVDGNVCRVLSRLRGIANTVKSPALKDVHGWDLASQIVQANAGEVNQALMELGATYCAPSGTGVDAGDPLREFYWSTKLGEEAAARRRRRLDNEDLMSEPASLLKNSCRTVNDNNETTTPVCKVCAVNGVRDALEILSESLDEAQTSDSNPFDMDTARRLGHAVFPLAPPKTAKKEDVLAVAAISCRIEEEEAWLLVRRPDNGLLAGQWEFPAACVWTSDPVGSKNGKKRDEQKVKCIDEVPVVSATKRRRALDSLLTEILATSENDCVESTEQQQLASVQRVQMGDPLEHIFSHVRHTMWVEHAIITDNFWTMSQLSWTDLQGREVRWMREADMQQVGVTAGVKKILKVVKQQKPGKKTATKQANISTMRLKPEARKRRRR